MTSSSYFVQRGGCFDCMCLCCCGVEPPPVQSSPKATSAANKGDGPSNNTNTNNNKNGSANGKVASSGKRADDPDSSEYWREQWWRTLATKGRVKAGLCTS
jgi:hypothetical protein